MAASTALVAHPSRLAEVDGASTIKLAPQDDGDAVARE
jgi:hypothetical protein